MQIREVITEFHFDCQVRKLSPKTIALYDRQLEYLAAYMENVTGITIIEEVRSVQGACSAPCTPEPGYFSRGCRPAYADNDPPDHCPGASALLDLNSGLCLNQEISLVPVEAGKDAEDRQLRVQGGLHPGWVLGRTASAFPFV